MGRLSAHELRAALARDLPDALLGSPAALPAPPEGGHGPKVERRPSDDTYIAADQLVSAALYLRDRLGYTFLSDICAVDYLADGVFELIYRFYHVAGGAELVLKLRVPRDSPEVPALTPHWPGANFHEREAFDLFGITFVGHPFLRRIYMWDEFEGFPMRKDFPKQGDKYIGEDE
jgi:NADH-quinone oxidoreductase subunit C